MIDFEEERKRKRKKCKKKRKKTEKEQKHRNESKNAEKKRKKTEMQTKTNKLAGSRNQNMYASLAKNLREWRMALRFLTSDGGDALCGAWAPTVCAVTETKIYHLPFKHGLRHLSSLQVAAFVFVGERYGNRYPAPYQILHPLQKLWPWYLFFLESLSV